MPEVQGVDTRTYAGANAQTKCCRGVLDVEVEDKEVEPLGGVGALLTFFSLVASKARTEEMIEKYDRKNILNENERKRFWQEIIRDYPYLALKHLDKYKDESFARELLMEAVMRDPYYASFMKDRKEKYVKEALAVASKLHSFALEFTSLMDEKGLPKGVKDINERAEALQLILRKENKHLTSNLNKFDEDELKNTNFISALDKFNLTHGTSIECMGIVSKPNTTKPNDPYRFVFINTFKNTCKRPVLITLTYKDIIEAKTEEDVTRLLSKLLTEEVTNNYRQHKIWAKDYRYDLPKNGRTAVMLSAVPGHLSGIESDMVRMAEIYKNHYGGQIYSVLMGNTEGFNEIDKVKKLKEKGGLPETTLATKENVLRNLEASITKAIDEGKEAFLWHYLMHGNQDGGIGATDGKITPKELAQILSTGYSGKISDYKGRELCSLIDINILAEQCFSGGLAKQLIEELEKNKIPVKNLRMVTSSASSTESFAGTRPYDASLWSVEMFDQSGTFAYYFSFYYELLEYLKKCGVEISGEAGTLSHAIRFVDRMAREDSFLSQDTQAVRYSYDPKTQNKILKSFATTIRELYNYLASNQKTVLASG